MEAKVDIRKLQLLNDRINQTIDALNQVRLSVYGLSHTAAGVQPQIPGMTGYGGVGYGMGQGIGYGVGAQPWNAFSSPFGLSHTSAPQQAPWLGASLGINPLYGNVGQQFGIPFGAQPFAQPFAAGAGVAGQVPWQLGISHSSPELEALRVSQTFPYAFAHITPFVAF